MLDAPIRAAGLELRHDFSEDRRSSCYFSCARGDTVLLLHELVPGWLRIALCLRSVLYVVKDIATNTGSARHHGTIANLSYPADHDTMCFHRTEGGDCQPGGET